MTAAPIDRPATLRCVRAQLAKAVSTVVDPGEVDDVVERMLRLIPRPEPANAAGPFYDSSAVALWLGITRQAVNHRAHVGTLLGLPSSRTLVFPVWQFRPDASTVHGLADVLAVLRDGTDDRWTQALWLAAPHDDLGGLSPADWLTDGRDPGPVLAAASADIARWAA